MKRTIKYITILAAMLTFCMGTWAANEVKQGTVTNATVTYSTTSSTDNFAASVSGVTPGTTVYMKVAVEANHYIRKSDITLTQVIGSGQAQVRTRALFDASVDFTLVSGDVADLNGEHVYSFIMPASGADVKVDAAATACTNISTAVVTVSLSKEYTGETLTADAGTISVTLGGTPLSSTSDYTITGNAGGVSVGSYNVSVTGKNTYCGTATGNNVFTITAKQVTVTVLPQTITYGGSIVTAPTAENIATYATLTGALEGDALTGITLATVHSQASATAYATGITGSAAVIKQGETNVSGNYVINYVPGALTINPKVATLSWSPSPATFTYDGAVHSPTATVSNLEAGDACSVTVTGGQTNVGDYTATATGLSNSNYTLTGLETSTLDFSITGATITVNASGFNGTYDGTAHSITVIPTPSDATVKYRTTAEGEYDLTTNPTYTNAGTYTVYYQVTKTNYTTAIGSATVTIEKAALKAVVMVNSPLEFYTSASAADITSGLAISKVWATGNDGDIEVPIANYTATQSHTDITQGHYTLTVAADEVNYTGTKTVAYSIFPSEISNEYLFNVAFDPTTPSYTYNGTEQKPEITVTKKSDSSSLTENTHYQVSFSDATNAGTVNVVVSGTGDFYGSKVLTYTIAKAPLTVTANAKNITYGEAPIHNGVSYDGWVNGESVANLGGTLDYEYNYERYGNVGDSCTITPKGLTSNNYNITFTPGALTVSKKTLTTANLSWGSSTFTYNGEAQAPEATVTSGLVNSDEVTVTVTGSQTNAGSHTATASALDGAKAVNYTLSGTPTQSFTINKYDIANATFADDIAAQSYTGSQITPTAPGIKMESINIAASEYDVTYGPNQNKGTGTVIYTAKAGSTNFTGTKVQSFSISNALNSFTAQPTITGWTYGEAPNAPSGAVASFGEPVYKFATADGTDDTFHEAASTTFTAGTWYVKAFVDGTEDYGSAKSSAVSFAIAKATPTIHTVPTTGAITAGQTLASSTLTDGNAKNPYNNADVAGTFTWTTASTTPGVADSETTPYEITFTPTDADNYNTNTTTATVRVNAAAPTTDLAATHTATTITVTAPTGAEYEYSIDGTNYQASAEFTGLTQNTEYTVYARYKATEHSNASAANTLAVTTDHAHDFAYTGINTDVLTATCGNSGHTGDPVTLTLTAAGGTYDGTITFGATTDVATFNTATGLTATVAIAYTGTPNGAAANSYSSTIAPTDAGAYTATATVTIGETDYELTKAFTVAKANSTITTPPTASAITYGQTLANSTLTGGVTTPAGTLAWTDDTTAPTVEDSGTEYGVTFTPDDANNYNTATTTVAVTVNAKTPTAADFDYTAPEALAYDGTAKAATVVAKLATGITGAVTVKYYKGGVEVTPTDAGIYQVKIDVAADGNYAAGANITDDAWTFEITPKAPTAADFSYTAPASLDYDETAKVATVAVKTGVTGMGEGITVKYYKGGVETAPVAGGTYQVKIDVTAGTNYTAATDLTDDAWSFTIGGATPVAGNFVYSAPAELGYDGTAKAATVVVDDGVSGMGAITLKYYKEDVETAPVNAGTYTVKINVAAGTNYTSVAGLTDDSWTFTITPQDVAEASLNVTAPSSVNTNQTPTVTVKAGTTTLTAGTDYDVTYRNSANEVVNPPLTATGTYTMVISPKPGGNYNFTPVEKTFTVTNPAPTVYYYSIDVTQPEHGTVSMDNNETYGAAGYTYYVTATADEGYYVESITVNGTAIEGNSFTMPYESVTVSAIIKAKTNIADATVTLDWTEKTYNGKTQKAAVSSVAVGETALAESDYTVTYAQEAWKNAGEYTITVAAAAGKNTIMGSKTVTFTIAKAALTVTADDKTMDQGDELPVLTVSYSGFVNGETESVLTTKPTASTTATKDSEAGTYDITVSGGAADNYSFSYVKGKLTIKVKTPKTGDEVSIQDSGSGTQISGKVTGSETDSETGKTIYDLTLTGLPESVLNGTTSLDDDDMKIEYQGNTYQVKKVDASAFEGQTPGVIIFLPDGVSTTAPVTNVVNGDGTSTELNLNNVTSFVAPRTVHADKVTYQRSTAAGFFTLCLPYDFQLPEGHTAWTLKKGVDGVAEFQAGGREVKAGEPYVIGVDDADKSSKVTRAGASIDLSAENVTIAATTSDKSVLRDEVEMFGTLAGLSLTKGAELKALVIQPDFSWKMAPLTSEMYVPAFECYLVVTGDMASTIAEGGSIPSSFGDTTGIWNITTDGQDAGDWYNLDGSRLEGKPKAKGMYIHNGHKIVVK